MYPISVTVLSAGVQPCKPSFASTITTARKDFTMGRNFHKNAEDSRSSSTLVDTAARNGTQTSILMSGQPVQSVASNVYRVPNLPQPQADHIGNDRFIFHHRCLHRVKLYPPRALKLRLAPRQGVHGPSHPICETKKKFCFQRLML